MHAVVVILLLVVVVILILVVVHVWVVVSVASSSTFNVSSSRSIHHNNNGSSSWRLLHAIVAVGNSSNTIVAIIATASYPSLVISFIFHFRYASLYPIILITCSLIAFNIVVEVEEESVSSNTSSGSYYIWLIWGTYVHTCMHTW